MQQETLSPLGKSTDAERALASIAMQHPLVFLTKTTELGFLPGMVLNPYCKAIIESCLNRAVKGTSCEILLVAEDLKTVAPELQFHELSEIALACPIPSALPEFVQIVRDAYIRRTLQQKLSEAMESVLGSSVKTVSILEAIGTLHEDLTRETVKVKARDTRTLLGEALTRYEVGEDKTSIVSTGFKSLDNITPIRYGDMLVIGGEPKAGKTMLALNIIANILIQDQNEHR